MKIRPAVIDYLLVFAASCVITVTIWPRGEARQILSLQTSDGQWQTRSLAISDPNLQLIDAKLKAIDAHNRSPEVAVAAWKEELLEFYQNSEAEDSSNNASQTKDSTKDDDAVTTASISDDVVTASYEEVDAREAEANAITRTSLQVPAAEIPKSEFPVELMGTIPPQKPSIAYQMAFLIGVLMACVYKHWLGLAPDQPGGAKPSLRAQIRRYSLASTVSLSLLAALLLITG